MPRTCSVCRHEHRAEIETALLGEEPLRNIAKRTGTSATALFRHRRDHVPAALVKAKRATEEVQAGNLFDRLKALNVETAAILAEARKAKNPAMALQAIARAEKQIELEAKLLGELKETAGGAGGTVLQLVIMSAGDEEPPQETLLPPGLAPRKSLPEPPCRF